MSWASHLAITDETGETFQYAQRTRDRAAGRPVAAATGDLSVALGPARRPARPPRPPATPWTMAGGDGHGSPRAIGGRREAAATRRPALRPGPPADGRRSRRRSTTATAGSTSARPAARTTTRGRRWRRPARSRSAARRSAVTGEAWFDHQWGDFIAVGGGGWDWFAVNLADGTDLTLSLVRDADGSYPLVYGTLVDADGHDAAPRRATPSPSSRPDRWTSPSTGADYPAGWRVAIPARASRST